MCKTGCLGREEQHESMARRKGWEGLVLGGVKSVSGVWPLWLLASQGATLQEPQEQGPLAVWVLGCLRSHMPGYRLVSNYSLVALDWTAGSPKPIWSSPVREP